MKSISKQSRFLALVSIFAALNIVCDSIAGIPQFSSGVWYSWIFMTIPITGLILQPSAAFLSTFIGVMIGHFLYPRGIYEFLFTLGAPFGAVISGLLLRRKFKIVIVYFATLFTAYFLTPISWQLPPWGMWDTFLAFSVLLITSVVVSRREGIFRQERLPFLFAIYAFIGLEADILFRIFLFIPCQTYRLLFFFNVEELQFIWLVGALTTPIQVALSSLFTSTIGVPLMRIVKSDTKNEETAI